MKRAAYWLTPPLACLALYWYGLIAWFFQDDFAWLRLAHEISNWRDLVWSMFVPKAQGTIRPWSERGFFILFYNLFGLDALPFRIWVLLTQFANLALIMAVVRRMTGSRAAGFWAAIFWTVNVSLGIVMAWTSAYNQALCGLFLLSAFYFLLRYLETGRRRDWVIQWVIFLFGFGALELNFIYPALAAGYTFLCARKHFRRTLPLFIPSAIFVVLHRMIAPPATAMYTMYFDLAIFKTLALYWKWSLGPAWLATMRHIPDWIVVLATAGLTAGALGFVAWSARKRQWLPLFLLSWFVLLLAPVLPLREHHMQYYPFLPSIGLAMLGATALVRAWQRPAVWKLAAIALAGVYVGTSAYASWITVKWAHARSRSAETLVLGVARAAQLHPKKAILLAGVNEELFGIAVVDKPFQLLGLQHVYLTPDSDIAQRPGWWDPNEFILPAGPALNALEREEAVVYQAGGERLKNITRVYTTTAQQILKKTTPRRVDGGNPLMAYLFGPEWNAQEPTHRWMPRRATVRIAGPRSASEKLHLWSRTPAIPESPEITITADGIKLPRQRVAPDAWFDIDIPLPAELAGRESIELTIETNRWLSTAEKEYGLAFGTLELR